MYTSQGGFHWNWNHQFLMAHKRMFLPLFISTIVFSSRYKFHLDHKAQLMSLVIESLDALLRQDLEDQGALEDLEDHLHHLCLVDLVDPRVKKRIIQ